MKVPKRYRPKKRARKADKRHKEVGKRKTANEAFAEINERLQMMHGELQTAGIDSRVRIHRYVNGSIDGELLVKVPRGTSSNDVAMEMEQAAGRASMPGYWINMGTRFTIKEDDEVYRRFRGFNDVNTHYQAATPANWSEIPFILRKQILAGMEKKYGRKADSIYTRVHWSPNGERPKSRG